MDCQRVGRQLGRFLDEELAGRARGEVEEHLEACPHCRAELAELRELVTRMADIRPLRPPDGLWERIEVRLHKIEVTATPQPAGNRRRRPRITPWAVAAGLVLAVGLGILSQSSLDARAYASTLDFETLLDALPLDAKKAFRKFLMRYDAKPTTPVAAKRLASGLNFETPSELPGGFLLQAVYELRIGGLIGIAASYERNGEFLAAVFHPPVKHEKFGAHENYPCVIGDHCGHKVQVGEWKLVHLTDSTTCHCLLSRLDEQWEIPAVMAEIAPLRPSRNFDTHSHP